MKCAKCRYELEPGARFCDRCGQPVGVASAPPEPVGTGQAPGEVRRFEAHADEVIKVAFSADGRQAASVSKDGVIHVWDIASGRTLRRLPGAGDIHAAAISRDGRRALTLGAAMHVWDLESGQESARFAGQGFVMCAALSPDGRRALFDGPDNSVVLWDLASGRELRRLESPQTMVQCVAFSADGRYGMSGSMEAAESDCAVVVWDLDSGRELHRPERMMTLVADVAFSPDGRRGLAGTLDANLYLWELDTGYELRRYEGHAGNVFSVAFSPDGQRLLSASGTDAFKEDPELMRDLGVDNTIRLWDAERQREIHRFEGHEGNVNCAVFSADGRYALSGSSDRTVRLWRLPQ